MASKKKIQSINSQKRKQAEMLNLLAQTLTIKTIAHLRKIGLSAVCRHLQRLIKKGYITKDRELTQAGLEHIKKFLLVSKIMYKTKSDKIRLHNLSFTISLIKIPQDWEKRRRKITKIKQKTYKIWKLQNWEPNSFYVDEIEIRTSPRSIILLFPEIYGNSPLGVTNKVIKILNGTIPKLENLFRVRLAREYYCNINFSSSHYAITNNEIAKLFIQKGWKLRILDEEGNIRLIIDNSKGLQELEAINSKYGEEDSQLIKDYLRDLILNRECLLPSQMTKEINKTTGLQGKMDHLIELTQGGLNHNQATKQLTAMIAQAQQELVNLNKRVIELLEKQESGKG